MTHHPATCTSFRRGLTLAAVIAASPCLMGLHCAHERGVVDGIVAEHDGDALVVRVDRVTITDPWGAGAHDRRRATFTVTAAGLTPQSTEVVYEPREQKAPVPPGFPRLGPQEGASSVPVRCTTSSHHASWVRLVRTPAGPQVDLVVDGQPARRIAIDRGSDRVPVCAQGAGRLLLSRWHGLAVVSEVDVGQVVERARLEHYPTSLALLAGGAWAAITTPIGSASDAPRWLSLFQAARPHPIYREEIDLRKAILATSDQGLFLLGLDGGVGVARMLDAEGQLRWAMRIDDQFELTAE